jgi:hypothetical protein
VPRPKGSKNKPKDLAISSSSDGLDITVRGLLKLKVEALAHIRSVSLSDAVREALEGFFEKGLTEEDRKIFDNLVAFGQKTVSP